MPTLKNPAVRDRRPEAAEPPDNNAPPFGLSPSAQRIRELSLAIWGPARAVEIVGRSPELQAPLDRLAKVAPFSEPILILGESGVGKESFAQAIYLLSNRKGRPFVSVNCPQYQDGNLTVSELFGHRRGSFTGAVADRKGCFETADGGVIFLDEVGDLHMSAQTMLLRALALGEFQPLGADQTRRVEVRVVAATNRNLNALGGDEKFRRDLLFRLRYFQIEIPPLRQRGEDWMLLCERVLDRLHKSYGVRKSFSPAALDLLGSYAWPGNVRELISVVTSGYALSDGDRIEPPDFIDRLEQPDPSAPSVTDDLYRSLLRESGDFWKIVQEPFLDRDLSRREVRRVLAMGLRDARGSYRRLLEIWRLPAESYQKFMDFLRHHRLKPGGIDDEGT
ncbi:MAG: sigma 54-interacting transcriptional regulator [Thermoanaerobaculia bacterium]